MIKPTQWSDWSAELPILAVPSIKGWELYEAIRERVDYLFAGEDTENIPSALRPILNDFNPNQDYKVIERNMHNAISELIPWFRNWTSDDARLWKEPDLLAALEIENHIEPNPYFLSAKWLKQAFRIVNYLRKKEDIVSITWIDEAQSIYTSGDTYDEHKNMFEKSIDFYTAVIQPGGSASGRVFGDSGRPSNVLYYSCDRDPCASMSSFVQAFNSLKSQYSATKYTIGLFVDSSGSMSLNTIAPAYTNFVNYLKEYYPTSKIIERTAGNESWLMWTKEYIDQLSFNFEFIEENQPVNKD